MKKRSAVGILKAIDGAKRSVRTLDRSLEMLARALASHVSVNGTPKHKGRSRPRLSPKARASMVLQGRYMGYMRQLKPRQKAQVRKIRGANGVRAAIQRARNLSR